MRDQESDDQQPETGYDSALQLGVFEPRDFSDLEDRARLFAAFGVYGAILLAATLVLQYPGVGDPYANFALKIGLFGITVFFVVSGILLLVVGVEIAAASLAAGITLVALAGAMALGLDRSPQYTLLGLEVLGATCAVTGLIMAVRYRRLTRAGFDSTREIPRP